jgi:hypothetical protein
MDELSGGRFTSVGRIRSLRKFRLLTTVREQQLLVVKLYLVSLHQAGVNTEDLNQVRDLGTSILGGGTNNFLCPTTFLQT